ncbi:MAG: Cof-type HAD-IIB family hydrolase [Acutalibacteraceae bacterium]
MPDYSKWLIVSDIDGTLYDSDMKCSKRNIEKLNEFIKYGGKFGVATGRAMKSAQNAVREIPTSCPSIVFNGGMICDIKTEQIYWQSYMDESAYDCVEFVYKNFPAASIEIHIDNVVYVARISEKGKIHISQASTTVKYVDFYDIPRNNWSKVLFAAEFAEIDELMKLIEPIKNDKCTFIRTSRQYYEILPLEAEKGKALNRLKDILGIDSDKVCAIGDFYNDLSLLDVAAISACPEESPQDVKNYADFVCGKCSDGAVADFIDIIEKKAKL